MRSKATESRIRAYECLEAVRRRDAFADGVIDKVVDSSPMSPSDRAFATRLVLGVVSTRGTLDFVLDRCMNSPRDVKPDVRDALRISTYEILYLDKSHHAAVDQGVELVRHVQPRAAGLANAVLRKVLAAKREFPFGDPSRSIDAYALLHAFPKWLAELLIADLGSVRARDFMVASNRPAPTFVHVCSLKGDDSETVSRLRAIDPGMKPMEACGRVLRGCFEIEGRSVSSPEFKELAKEGCVLVSDASAQFISELAAEAACNAVGDSERIEGDAPSCLELCAGRGTKTILLQDAMKRILGRGFGKYVALDNVKFKTRLLSERSRLFGANVDESLCADILAASPLLEGRLFDMVFLDAPCSGLGTLRRHPEIRWRVAPEVIAEDARRDVSLLRAAARFAAPGGVLAYSTCTVTRAENEHAVEAFLETSEGRGFRPVTAGGSPVVRTYLADGGWDAHFAAFFEREKVR